MAGGSTLTRTRSRERKAVEGRESLAEGGKRARTAKLQVVGRGVGAVGVGGGAGPTACQGLAFRISHRTEARSMTRAAHDYPPG